jgi:hypothetical protein
LAQQTNGGTAGAIELSGPVGIVGGEMLSKWAFIESYEILSVWNTPAAFAYLQRPWQRCSHPHGVKIQQQAEYEQRTTVEI